MATTWWTACSAVALLSACGGAGEGELCGRDTDCAGDLVCSTHRFCEPIGGAPGGPFEAGGFVSVEPNRAVIFPAQPFELRIRTYDVVGVERPRSELVLREAELGHVEGDRVIAERLGTLHIDVAWAGRTVEHAALEAIDHPADSSTPIELHLFPIAQEMTLGAVVPLEARVYAEDGTRVEPFISYESSDPSVASVTRFGSVTALAAGFARIEVRVVDRPELRATFGALVRDRYSKLREMNPCLDGPFAAGCHLHRSGEQLYAIVQQVCPSTVITTTFGRWTSAGDVGIDERGQVFGTGTGTIEYRAELPRPDLADEPLCQRLIE